MSKIALVFNGHSRTFCDHVESLERNVINPTGCDVIINTWSNVDGGFSQIIKDAKQLQLTENQLAQLNGVKNLVKLEVVPEERHVEVKNIDACFPRHTRLKAAPKYLSAGLYARKLSSDLLDRVEKERGSKYDAVISMTMDACVHTPFNKHLIEQTGTLFIPYPRHIKGKKIATSGRIAFGDRETMRFWLDMYDDFEKHSKHASQGQTVITMESIVADAILTNNIKYDGIDMSYSMHRLNGVSITYDHTRPAEMKNPHKTPCGCRRTK